MSDPNHKKSERRILGLNFYSGDAQGAIDRISQGGLLVVPAAPALKNLEWNRDYREALINADLAITDSALMVLLWNALQYDSVPRLSGLRYMRQLLLQPILKEEGQSFWIMATPASSATNREFLKDQGIQVPEHCVYVAPVYGSEIEDLELIRRLKAARASHVVITIGGGTQERLGLYIKRNLDYLPAIHCIGAAIAFLSGDQVRIPDWADRFYLGWLFRCLSSPQRYIPRYFSAYSLVPIMWRYRDRLPPFRGLDIPHTRLGS